MHCSASGPLRRYEPPACRPLRGPAPPSPKWVYESVDFGLHRVRRTVSCLALTAAHRCRLVWKTLRGWSEIDAAVPTVFAATQEKFVPQMINFEVLGGVDFKKGCYPGQEIVARSQYLGKLKRRMRPAHVDADDPPSAGSDIVHSSDGQAVGTVVMSARAPGGGCDLLFEAPIDRVEAGTLQLGDSSGAMLQVRPLPYALFDPTA
jgi:tRNA-modifying protein YgfZ